MHANTIYMLFSMLPVKNHRSECESIAKDVALNTKDVALNTKDVALNTKDVALNTSMNRLLSFVHSQ